MNWKKLKNRAVRNLIELDEQEEYDQLNKKISAYSNAIDNFLRKKSNELVEIFPDLELNPRILCISLFCNVIANHGFEMISSGYQSVNGILSEEEFCETVKKYVLQTISHFKYK